MERDRERAVRAAKRLVLLWLILGIAFLVGIATGSLAAFVAIFAAGLVVTVVMRLADARWRARCD